MRVMVLAAVLFGAVAFGDEPRLHLELGGGPSLAISSQRPVFSAHLFGAVQWRAAELPLGVELRLEPAQVWALDPAMNHDGHLLLFGRYVAQSFEVALGLSGVARGPECHLELPPGASSEVDVCNSGLGVLPALRVRFGASSSHHLILRSELPLSVGARGAVALSDRLQLLADGELGFVFAHVDGGVRFRLPSTAQATRVAFVVRGGWEWRSFLRVSDVNFNGPRLLVGAEWEL